MALSGTARCLLVPVVAALGCYPEFSFDEPGGNGGSGTVAETSTARVAVGTGGSSDGPGPTTTSGHTTTTSTTGPTTTTTTSTGMAPVVQVNCGPADLDLQTFDWFLMTCAPGQVCCFDEVLPSEDHCGSECDPDAAYTFACDGPQDCAPGQVCCANVSGSTVIGIACVAGCASPNIELCESTADCTNGGTCQVAFGDDGYDEDYLGCL
ncbi:MAG: hypothetical protein HOV80_39045 [Polyangiaceae bacterium]|nr:hypothetical protein [Polyangiaceae bacterium]